MLRATNGRVVETVLLAVCLAGAGCGSPQTDDGTGPSAGGMNAAGSSAGTTGGSAGALPGGGAGLPGGGAGTGGSAGAGASVALPDIDPTSTIWDLTSKQLGQLCDWDAALFGGYGVTTVCGGSMQTSWANQNVCIDRGFTFPCSVTVAQYEACERSKVPAKDCSLDSAACDPVNCK